MEEIDVIDAIGFHALIQAYKTQKALQAQGTIADKVKKGKGQDTALRGDFDSEEAVINFLREQKFPARVYAEEHGVINLVKNPEFLVVLDGIDGSSGLAADINARCGTVLAIAPNLNPGYKDFTFAGLTEFVTNRILRTSQAFPDRLLLKDFSSGTHIPSSTIKQTRKKTGKVYVDDPSIWESYEKGITSGLDEIGALVHGTFTTRLKNHYKLSGFPSSSSMCLDLVLGQVDAVCGVRAKGVYEPPAEYLLLRRIGGTIVDLSGKDIGERYWLDDRGKLAPLLRASSPQIAREVLNIVNQ